MRFAGTRMEGFLGNESPDYGSLSQKGYANKVTERNTGTDLMGKTAATGIAEAGKVEAANITGAAQAALANAQGQASIMSGIGKIGGAFIGAGIDAGAFGGGIGKGADFGEVGTSGSDLADFGYTPEQDRAYHNGGIDYGWL